MVCLAGAVAELRNGEVDATHEGIRVIKRGLDLLELSMEPLRGEGEPANDACRGGRGGGGRGRERGRGREGEGERDRSRPGQGSTRSIQQVPKSIEPGQ